MIFEHRPKLKSLSVVSQVMNNIVTFGQKEATNRPEEIKITSGINKTSLSFTYHVLSIKKFRMIRESISNPKKNFKSFG